MKKSKLGVAHIALFIVAIGSVGYSATNYIRDEMDYRRKMAAPSRTNRSSGGGAGQGQADSSGAGRSGGFNPQQMAQRQLEQMSQKLKLTAPQKAQIKAIQDKDIPRTKAIFDDKSIPANQKWTKLRPLRAATDAAIKKVLTPAQQTQYAALQTAARAQWGGGGGGTRGGGTRSGGTRGGR